MIQPERIRRLNDGQVRDGSYVLYWMQAAQRTVYNHALEYSIRRANELGNCVVVFFGLTDRWPEANLRHYYFMLEGLKEVRRSLAARGIQLVVRHVSPELGAVDMAERAALVVVDGGQLRVQRKWRRHVAKKIKCPLYEVETNLIVPVEEAAAAENFSAGTFRPRITRQLSHYLVPLRHRRVRRDSLGLR
ncbi:MAG: deoxyribodipyrimidine photo-lyase, partial [Phycisphaerales bacterium]